MRISEALALFTHLIALLGFASIGFTGHVDPLGVAVFMSALALSFVNDKFGRNYYLSQNVVTGLAFFLLAYVTAGVFFLGVEVFGAILTFLVYTQAIKLLGRKELRDITQIFVLSFFQFLAGSILTVDFSYALAFVLYIVVALWAIMVFTIKKESFDAKSSEDPVVITPLFLTTSVLVGVFIFLFTALLFVSFPRVKAGVFMSDFIKPEFLKTGFSDEIELGRVGEIKRDSSPVMRVKILDNPYPIMPGAIYWRGIALDEFDGVSWRVSGDGFTTHKEGKNDIIGVANSEGHKLLEQEVITEPLDTDILFAADSPVAFRGIAGRKIASVNDSYILPGRTSLRLKYIVYSDLTSPNPDTLRLEGEDYPESIAERYLKLPALPERIGELARRVASIERNPYDKAVSIKRYLLDNMTYTLTLDGGQSAFPLEDFLFQSRAGHCEYFATAMVVLLREAGVPARIVNGFLGGEWNEHGRFYLVRESEAHSWVEVFFPESGWVVFDPTPAGSGDAGGIRAFSYIASYVDYLRYRWSRYVVDFNQRDQIRILSGVRDNWRWQRAKLKNGADSALSKPDLKWIAGAAVLAFGIWAIFTVRPDMKSVFRRSPRNGDEAASIFYKKALSLLSKKGFPKPEDLTPREFARFVAASGRGFRSFDAITERYLDMRYRAEGASDEEIKDLHAMLKTLADEAKKLN